MKEPIQFINTSSPNDLESMKEKWRKSLTAPQDGMWESFIENAHQWLITLEEERIGYACVDQEGRLIQFFVLPQWGDKAPDILEEFIRQEGIQKAMVGTNNPVFLSTTLHFQQSVTVDSYFFTEYISAEVPEKEGVLKGATSQNLEAIVEFCHLSIGAPKEWLEAYVQHLIDRKEFFFLRNEKDIIGTCEVRKSPYGQVGGNRGVADIGMIVSPHYRKQGYGAFLLGKAKQIAIQEGRKPICSCEKDNVGSLKAIRRNGFRSVHRLLEVEF